MEQGHILCQSYLKDEDAIEVKIFLSILPQNISVSSTACNPEENSKEVVPEMFIWITSPRLVSGNDEPVHINNITSTIRPSPFPTSNQPDLNSCKKESRTEQQSGINNLSLSGTEKVDKDGILQLINNTGRLMDHALFPAPIQFKNSDTGPVMSFSTCFVFNMVPEYPRLGGHGLAFTVAPSQDFIKSALRSRYLGLLNATEVGNFSNHLFAVEFDTRMVSSSQLNHLISVYRNWDGGSTKLVAESKR